MNISSLFLLFFSVQLFQQQIYEDNLEQKSHWQWFAKKECLGKCDRRLRNIREVSSLWAESRLLLLYPDIRITGENFNFHVVVFYCQSGHRTQFCWKSEISQIQVNFCENGIVPISVLGQTGEFKLAKVIIWHEFYSLELNMRAWMLFYFAKICFYSLSAASKIKQCIK